MLPISYCLPLRAAGIFSHRKVGFGDRFWVCDGDFRNAEIRFWDEDFTRVQRSRITIFCPSLVDMVKYMGGVDRWVRMEVADGGWRVIFDKIVSEAHEDVEISAADAITKYIDTL